MTARGKREARRPWLITPKMDQGLKGRNNTGYFALSGLEQVWVVLTQGDALRGLPWAFISRAVGAPLLYIAVGAPFRLLRQGQLFT